MENNNTIPQISEDINTIVKFFSMLIRWKIYFEVGMSLISSLCASYFFPLKKIFAPHEYFWTAICAFLVFLLIFDKFFSKISTNNTKQNSKKANTQQLSVNQQPLTSILTLTQNTYYQKITKSLSACDFFAIMRCNYNESDNSLHFHIHNEDRMCFLLCYNIETISVNQMNNTEFQKYHELNAILPKNVQKVELYFKISFFPPDNHDNKVDLLEADYDLYIQHENNDMEVPRNKKIIVKKEVLDSFKTKGMYTELNCQYTIKNNDTKEKIDKLWSKTNQSVSKDNTGSIVINSNGEKWDNIKRKIEVYIVAIYL